MTNSKAPETPQASQTPDMPEPFPILPHIAALLAKAVKKSSLREVATDVGVSHGTIHRVIKGSPPDVFTFLKLINHFGLVPGSAFESPAHLSLEKWEKPSECREILVSFFTPWQRAGFEKVLQGLMDAGGMIQCYSVGEYLRFEVAAEELECIKMHLDRLGVPTEKEGKKLSYVGRIQALTDSVKNSGKTPEN